MTGYTLLPVVLLSAAVLAAGAPARPESADPAVPPHQPVAAERPAARILEMRAHRRSGVVSAELANGLCIHHRRMTTPSGRVEVMISFAGGELLECPETRGLTLLSASFFDRPAAADLDAEQIRQRLAGRDLRLEGGLMSDALRIRIWGSAADIRTGLEIAAAVLREPRVSDELLDSARTVACDNVQRAEADARWAITEPLLELVMPMGECRNKLACTKRMSAFTADQVRGWIVRHATAAPCEIAIVGDIECSAAIAAAAEIFGELPRRDRPAPATMAEKRCVGKHDGPFAREVGCEPGVKIQEAHVLAGFLSPDPSQIMEVRRLRAGARVLSERLENRLRELKLGGDPHVSWTYMPSPFAGRSVTVVAARVAPGDAEPVKQVMQASMCELIDQGLPAAELARSTELLANVSAAYERDPRYWASILARSASSGMDPEQIAGGASVYRAMKPEEVIDAMRRACTVENRLDLIVRPGN